GDLGEAGVSQSSSARGKTVIVAYDLVTPSCHAKASASAGASCLGRSGFARQKRKEFRGEFAPLQTVTNLSRRAHRPSVSTLRAGCERWSRLLPFATCMR